MDLTIYIWKKLSPLLIVILCSQVCFAQNMQIRALSPPPSYWDQQDNSYKTSNDSLKIEIEISQMADPSAYELWVSNVHAVMDSEQAVALGSGRFEKILPIQAEILNRVLVSLIHKESRRLIQQRILWVQHIPGFVQEDLSQKINISVDGIIDQQGDTLILPEVDQAHFPLVFRVNIDEKLVNARDINARVHNLKVGWSKAPEINQKALEASLVLVEGENLFSIRATHRFSRITQEVWVKIKANLGSTTISGKSYALYISNYEYPSTSKWSSLKTPLANAKAMEEVLTTMYGFETLDFLENPLKQDIRGSLKNLLSDNRSWDKEDQLLLFISGHGRLDDEFNLSYYAPSDAVRDDPNLTNYYQFDVLLNSISQIPVKNLLVIIDACYGASSMINMEDLVSIKGNPKQQLINIKRNLNCEVNILLSASGLDRTASDKPIGEKRLSDFVEGIIQVLNDRSNLKKGYLTVSELFFYLESLDLTSPPHAKRFGQNPSNCKFLFYDPKFREK